MKNINTKEIDTINKFIDEFGKQINISYFVNIKFGDFLEVNDDFGQKDEAIAFLKKYAREKLDLEVDVNNIEELMLVFHQLQDLVEENAYFKTAEIANAVFNDYKKNQKNGALTKLPAIENILDETYESWIPFLENHFTIEQNFIEFNDVDEIDRLKTEIINS